MVDTIIITKGLSLLYIAHTVIKNGICCRYVPVPSLHTSAYICSGVRSQGFSGERREVGM
jgi:hypothetical protein